MNILWDFDGTLFNTYPVYTKIFKKAFGKDIPEAKIYELLKVSFTHANQYFQLTEGQINTINVLENEISPKDVPPFSHVEDILKFAKVNVIMTHKTRAGVDDILKYYGWNHYFKEIITIDDGFPRKPHPASYEYLYQRHHLDLIVGDRKLDILPGKELGIETCLYENKQPGADYYLSDYKDFFTIFSNQLGGR